MRTCGSCRLCCKLMAVPEIEKPQRVWCKFVDLKVKENACMIYEDRPQPCRDFECGWLQMEGIMPDEMRPDRIHAVLTALAPGKDGFAIFIDPAYPLAYKDEPWLVKTIDGIVDRGGAIVLVIGNKRKLIQKGKLDEEMQA